MRIACYGCAADVGARERVGRRDTCPSCGVDLHSCRQCRFYDTRAYNECREPQAERVLDKERANFCDWFATSDAAAAVPSGLGARAELDRLFRRH
jgi:hypothetical protein